MRLSLDHLKQLVKAMEKNIANGVVPGENDAVIVDWDNHSISVLSPIMPTLLKNGTPLILSDGPAFHQEYLFHLADFGGNSQIVTRK